jgi:hypothetical protein
LTKEIPRGTTVCAIRFCWTNKSEATKFRIKSLGPILVFVDK